MADPNNLDDQNTPCGERRASLNNAEHSALIARLIEVENAVKSEATNREAQNKKTDADKELLYRVKTGEVWMICLTVLIFLVSAFQAYETWTNNSSTGKQVERIINATNRIDDAADSFSISSANMSRSMNDAVNHLGEQAGNTQIVAKQAAAQTEIARQNLHVGNDPILVVPVGDPKPVPPINSTRMGNTLDFSISYANLGRTPAVAVVVTALVDFDGQEQLPPIPPYEGLTGIPIAAGGTNYAKASKRMNPGEGTNEHRGTDYGNRGFSILGYIQYRDLFGKGNTHITAFCNWYPYNPYEGNLPRQCKNLDSNWFEHPPNRR